MSHRAAGACLTAKSGTIHRVMRGALLLTPRFRVVAATRGCGEIPRPAACSTAGRSL